MAEKKSQLVIESIIILAVLVVIIVVFMGVNFNRQSDLTNIRRSVDLESECTRLSNMINEVYKSGPGTQINTKTEKLLTIYEDKRASVKDVDKIKNKIAILLSEVGPSTQAFYNTINSKLTVDWYKVCFDDSQGAGCPPGQPWDSITNQLPDLIMNIDEYETIYMEDPHLHKFSSYQGKTYYDIIDDWVESGNVLLVGEHYTCLNYVNGPNNPSNYQCNGPDDWNNLGSAYDNYNVFDFFNYLLFQYDSEGVSSPEKTLKVVNVIDPYSFNLGQEFKVAESNFVVPMSTNQQKIEAETLDTSGYSIPSNPNQCDCGGNIGTNCLKSVGSGSSQAWITFQRSPSQQGQNIFDVTIKFCSQISNNPSNEWELIIDGVKKDSWSVDRETDKEQWIYRVIKNLAINDNQELRFKCNDKGGTAKCKFDFFIVGIPSEETVIAKYKNTERDGILFWPHGNGYVHYIADFQVVEEVGGLTQQQYTEKITHLIQRTYYIIDPLGDEILCPLYAEIPYFQVSGNITIVNNNNTVQIVENY